MTDRPSLSANSFTAADFAREKNVSRETFSDFTAWHALLLRWNRRINLVSAGALDGFWHRHALDSWQVADLALTSLARPGVSGAAKTVLDLGSGAGFPGLAIAIALKSRPELNASVTLVESAGKKANFLRAVIRTLALPASVKSARVESLPPEPKPNIITARAFAPLPKLLEYSAPFWGVDTIGIFPKGAQWAAEDEAARMQWAYTLSTSDSRTEADAKILQITNLRAKANGNPHTEDNKALNTKPATIANTGKGG